MILNEDLSLRKVVIVLPASKADPKTFISFLSAFKSACHVSQSIMGAVKRNLNCSKNVSNLALSDDSY